MYRLEKIALIPAYEPEPLMNELLEKLSSSGFENVVVDDGSGAAYAEIFQKAAENAVVLTHPVNRGKGRALKTGLSYILEHFGPDVVVVTVDADGQHSPQDAARLCDIAAARPDTLVLGSRKLKGDIPLRSRVGNALTRLVYRLSTGLRVYDTQTGLRAFHAALLPKLLEIGGERYEYEMNVLLEFARNRIPILEEEIETIYIDNNSGSHFDTVRDSYRVYKEILKFSASSLAGFAVDYVLYCLLLLITGNISVSNIGARVVSASVNYTLNRKYVFKSSSGILRSASSYFLLAALILFGNTMVLGLLVNDLGVNRLIAKLITEILFFSVSWLVQKTVIFKEKAEEVRTADNA